jgi:hypothetical protein
VIAIMCIAIMCPSTLAYRWIISSRLVDLVSLEGSLKEWAFGVDLENGKMGSAQLI